MLAGAEGAASQLAMRVIVKMAELAGAAELIGIASAHIDGCLFHGYAGLDFAERLVRGGAAVRVPTTLNVSSLDLLHPDRYPGRPGDGQGGQAADGRLRGDGLPRDLDLRALPAPAAAGLR